jgi:hypothetical protein
VKAATAIRRPLSVVEDAERCLVVVDGDAEDWLVSFTKADDFDAAAWAHAMAGVHNQRLGRPADRRG